MLSVILKVTVPIKEKECYAAVKTFKEFCNNSCRFGDVSVAFMTAYREYLLKSTKADGRCRYSTNTASGYLKNFYCNNKSILISIVHFSIF